MKKIFFVACFLVLLGVTLAPIPLCAQASGEEDFNQIFMNYYWAPGPRPVTEILTAFLTSPMFRKEFKSDRHALELAAYFFGRLAEINPALLRDYERIYDKADAEGKTFVLTTFVFYRDGKTEEFIKARFPDTYDQEGFVKTILERPPLGRAGVVKDVADAGDLDFLWMEFFLTGDRQPIRNIIDVLAWEDILRGRFKALSASSPSEVVIKELQFIVPSLFGADLDMKSGEVYSEGDLDCVYAAVIRDPGQFYSEYASADRLRTILKLTGEDLLKISAKGEALRSLMANVQPHPKVFKIVTEEIRSRNNKAVVELKTVARMRK